MPVSIGFLDSLLGSSASSNAPIALNPRPFKYPCLVAGLWSLVAGL